ncbi:MAG: DUF4156 domain-containing protein [Thermoanaerobaculia bacterium]
MKIISVIILAILSSGCVSASPEAQKVRVTSNPDVVKPCEFLGNVKAMSGWGGAAGSGVAASNVEETLKERTHKLGGNVVYVVGNEGSRGSGEAYRCP